MRLWVYPTVGGDNQGLTTLLDRFGDHLLCALTALEHVELCQDWTLAAGCTDLGKRVAR